MPKIVLADVQEAAKQKYDSLFVEVPGGDVELVSPLRLSKKARGELSELITSTKDANAAGGTDLDAVVASMEQMITLAAKTPAQGKRLLAAIGGDLATLVELTREYTAAVQLGEAPPSQS
jgi:hypothetical protein